MSNGMAFVAGAGLAGIAALLFLKGGGTPGLYNLPAAASLQAPQNLQQPVANPALPGLTPPQLAPIPATGASNPAYCANCAQQQLENAQLKTQIEQLQTQLRNQQFVIDAQSAQMRNNGGLNPQINPAQLTAGMQSTNPNMTSMMWALGGMGVTVTAGLLMAGVFALVSRQQRPPAGTVQLIHPINQLPPSLPYKRRSEYASPRYEEKRASYLDYDEYDDYKDYEGR